MSTPSGWYEVIRGPRPPYSPKEQGRGSQMMQAVNIERQPAVLGPEGTSTKTEVEAALKQCRKVPRRVRTPTPEQEQTATSGEVGTRGEHESLFHSR